MRVIFLAFLFQLGHVHSTDTVRSIPFAIGGARVPFTFDTAFDEKAKFECSVNDPNGAGGDSRYSPTIPFDRQHIICRLPPEKSSGKVVVTLEATTAIRDIYSGAYQIIPEPGEEMTVKEDWDNSQLQLTWDPTYFSQYLPPGAPLLLEVAFYVSHQGSTNFVPAGNVQVVGLNNPGTAQITVSASNLAEISNFLFPYYYVLRQVGTQSDVFLASRIFTPTLGKSPDDAKNMCGAWLATATGPPADITPCPNCLCKAKLDENFIQAQYHPQILELAAGQLAGHVLYYERVPTSSGGAQTCSYNSKTEALAVSSPAQAGWVHQVSKDVSYVGNYLSDIWPYIVCCLESGAPEYCNLFHDKRPVDDGREYPGADDPCYGTGDPHMSTIDGVKYDFMGYGEFWLIHGNKADFGVQARMSPMTPSAKVTYYRAVAVREGNSTVQISHDSSNKLQILLNGEDVLQIPTKAVTIPLGGLSLSINGNQVKVRMQTGFTIRADSFGTYFNLYGSGAQKNKGKGFMGIFGNFDGNATNDLTSRSGLVIEPTPANLRNLSLIHNGFGLTWMITEEESFFTYENGTSWDDFNNVTFGAYDELPDPSTFPEEVRQICKESLACYYEYLGTGELGDAEAVVGDEENLEELKEELEKVVLQCDKIPPPQNGRVSVEGYLNGSMASYSCDEDYEVTGAEMRTCLALNDTAEWDGEEPICLWTCGQCSKEVEYQLTHDPSDCNKYFLCSSGVRYSLQCPVGESFNPEFFICDKNYACSDPPGCRR